MISAQCYRIVRDVQASVECYFKAAELFKKIRAFFHAAKALENAIIVGKEMTQPDVVIKFLQEHNLNKFILNPNYVEG